MRRLLFLMISIFSISVGQAGAEDAGSVAKISQRRPGRTSTL